MQGLHRSAWFSIIALGVLPHISAQAPAAQVTYHYEPGQGVPLFDPAMGTLNEVIVRVEVYADAYEGITNASRDGDDWILPDDPITGYYITQHRYQLVLRTPNHSFDFGHVDTHPDDDVFSYKNILNYSEEYFFVDLAPGFSLVHYELWLNQHEMTYTKAKDLQFFYNLSEWQKIMYFDIPGFSSGIIVNPAPDYPLTGYFGDSYHVGAELGAYSVTYIYTPVPETSAMTTSLIGMALLGIGVWRRRRSSVQGA